MKRWSFFLFPAFLLLAFSCNMEKRLYRNGWYMEKSNPRTYAAVPVNDPAPGVSAYENREKPDAAPAVAADSAAVADFPVDAAAKPQPPDTSLPKKDVEKMSYRELMRAMKEKGCEKPNSSARAIYWLAVVSICIFWMLPLSLILALTVVLMCESAEKEVIAKGECPRENLALIHKGRRLATGLFFVSAVVAAALVAFLAVALVLLITEIL